MTAPIRDNTADRAVGQHWENQFCHMARLRGKVFTPHQFNRPGKSALFYGPSDLDGKSRWTLPDITIWSAPGEHHEIKHKNPTFDGMYGLERYRLDALVRFGNTTGQPVYYTIHDWDRAGATSSSDPVDNRLEDWLVGDIAQLSRGYTRLKPDEWTYYNGVMRQMETWYWSADPDRRTVRWFRPLAELWAV